MQFWEGPLFCGSATKHIWLKFFPFLFCLQTSIFGLAHGSTLDVVRISSCHWIFDHKWFSEADTSKGHIEHIIFFLYPLANPLTTDLFWCRLYQLGKLAEKQCPWVDRLEGEEKFFCGQCVPNGCLLWKMTYGKISDHMKKLFITSNRLIGNYYISNNQ